jgi:hypothetical protein
MPNLDANKIDHVALVIDRSASMWQHTDTVVRVVDDTVKHLADRSRQIDREVRVSVYFFDWTVECVIFDKDVLRLPSIKGMYKPDGRTALVDATMKSLEDLATTSQLYGDHAFLIYVVTDGQENQSVPGHLRLLPERLAKLEDNWTVGVLVPDARGVYDAKRFGFPENNIAEWDATSAAGVVSVGETIRRTTDTFLDNRTAGVRSTRSLFSTGTDAVNADTVKANLTPLPYTKYVLLPATERMEMKPFVEDKGLRFVLGSAFYPLTKKETIQPQKQIMVLEKSTDRVYSGDNARALIGLPDGVSVQVDPDANPDYTIYVQSTAPNRKVLPGWRVLVRL